MFFNPAAQSVLPGFVEADELVGANTAVWSAAVISQVALAPAAGALVAWAGPGPAFAVNAGSFVVSAMLIASLPSPAKAARVGRHGGRDVAEGLRVIRRAPLLRGLAVAQGLAALSAGATSALLVVLAESHLHVGPARFGVLLGAIGVGAGLGPLVLQRFVREVRRPVFLFGPYALRGVVDLSLAASSSFAGASVSLAAYGVGTSTGNVTYNSVLQTAVPDRYRGRVFAFFDVVWQAARLASVAAGGALADALGIRAVYAIGGALLLLAASVGFSTVTSRDMTASVADG